MKKVIILLLAFIASVSTTVYQVNAKDFTDQKYPVGKPGLKLTYNSKANDLPGSVVRALRICCSAWSSSPAEISE